MPAARRCHARVFPKPGSIRGAWPRDGRTRQRTRCDAPQAGRRSAAYAYGLLAREDVTPEVCEAAKAKVEAAYKGLTLTTSYEDVFKDAGLVIESIAENPQEKVAFYTEMAKHLPEKTIVCTNSSTMPPSAFAQYTGRPERYLALHFGNSIWKNPLAEVMPHAGTDMANLAEVVKFAASIRMVPVKVLKEQPGYLLNSMLVPFLTAAESLWAAGIGEVGDIDMAWKLGTGSPLGPFQILDIVGLTTAYNIGSMNPAAKDPDSVQAKVVALLKEKVDKGETGIVAGKGFYEYGKK